MKINFSLIAMVTAMVCVTGCTSTKKFNALYANYNKLQDRNSELTREGEECKSNLDRATVQISGLRDQLNAEREHVKSLQSALDKCLTSASQGNVNVSKLVDEINSSNKYIQELIASKNKSDSLNMVLTNNLTRSLSKDEMQDVDVQVLKGVVYISLSDNMLYKSGSYEISDKAGATLAKIAKIITDYKDYDVLIEGNTDNVPISKPNIRNNWDLSALRASSVVQALQNNYGVDPQRLTAGGRGEYNPVDSNDTPEGKTRNRRTQIIITPKLNQFMDLIGKGASTDSTGTH
ncbi:OmpA/MotB family protein [Ginsengibacter hankyongi]|uniref:OmpA/MotB family protein n=1 Tax=Ginsengibacter hankyongi TaxID=2607284 RepID=UPI001F431FAA|nr:OmpA family protein [Ginsengibacter hankyongi]